MSMLAERKQKQRWSLNPRGKLWTEDSAKFGQKMLEKMGWKHGKGLGANENGITEHVKLNYKNDQKGMGFKETEQWTEHEDNFSKLLANLNGDSDRNNTAKIKSLHAKAENIKARINYHKFTRGKDLSRYSDKDLANIFGKKSLKSKPIKDEPESKPKTVHKTSDDLLINKGSITDYFKKKLPNFGKLNNTGFKIGNNGVLTKEDDLEIERPPFGFGFNSKDSDEKVMKKRKHEGMTEITQLDKKKRVEEVFLEETIKKCQKQKMRTIEDLDNKKSLSEDSIEMKKKSRKKKVDDEEENIECKNESEIGEDKKKLKKCRGNEEIKTLHVDKKKNVFKNHKEIFNNCGDAQEQHIEENHQFLSFNNKSKKVKKKMNSDNSFLPNNPNDIVRFKLKKTKNKPEFFDEETPSIFNFTMNLKKKEEKKIEGKDEIKNVRTVIYDPDLLDELEENLFKEDNFKRKHSKRHGNLEEIPNIHQEAKCFLDSIKPKITIGMLSNPLEYNSNSSSLSILTGENVEEYLRTNRMSPKKIRNKPRNYEDLLQQVEAITNRKQSRKIKRLSCDDFYPETNLHKKRDLNNDTDIQNVRPVEETIKKSTKLLENLENSQTLFLKNTQELYRDSPNFDEDYITRQIVNEGTRCKTKKSKNTTGRNIEMFSKLNDQLLYENVQNKESTRKTRISPMETDNIEVREIADFKRFNYESWVPPLDVGDSYRGDIEDYFHDKHYKASRKSLTKTKNVGGKKLTVNLEESQSFDDENIDTNRVSNYLHGIPNKEYCGDFNDEELVQKVKFSKNCNNLHVCLKDIERDTNFSIKTKNSFNKEDALRPKLKNGDTEKKSKKSMKNYTIHEEQVYATNFGDLTCEEDYVDHGDKLKQSRKKLTEENDVIRRNFERKKKKNRLVCENIMGNCIEGNLESFEGRSNCLQEIEESKENRHKSKKLKHHEEDHRIIGAEEICLDKGNLKKRKGKRTKEIEEMEPNLIMKKKIRKTSEIMDFDKTLKEDMNNHEGALEEVADLEKKKSKKRKKVDEEIGGIKSCNDTDINTQILTMKKFTKKNADDSIKNEALLNGIVNPGFDPMYNNVKVEKHVLNTIEECNEEIGDTNTLNNKRRQKGRVIIEYENGVHKPFFEEIPRSKEKGNKKKKRDGDGGITNPCFEDNTNKPESTGGIENPSLDISDTDLMLNVVTTPILKTERAVNRTRKNVRFSSCNEERIIPNNYMQERNELFDINTEIVEQSIKDELEKDPEENNGFINNGFDIRSIDNLSFFETKPDANQPGNGIDNVCFNAQSQKLEEKVQTMSKTIENCEAELDNDINEFRNYKRYEDDIYVGENGIPANHHCTVPEGVKLSFKNVRFGRSPHWMAQAETHAKKSYKHLIKGDIIVAFKSANLHEINGYGNEQAGATW